VYDRKFTRGLQGPYGENTGGIQGIYRGFTAGYGEASEEKAWGTPMQHMPELGKAASPRPSQSGASGEAQRPNLSGTLQTRAGSQQGGTLRQDNGVLQKCFVCGEDAEAGGWFCQIAREDKRIALCSPYCALSYFNTGNPASGANGQERTDYQDRVHFVVNGE
jgi:hypothetical protein